MEKIEMILNLRVAEEPELLDHVERQLDRCDRKGSPGERSQQPGKRWMGKAL